MGNVNLNWNCKSKGYKISQSETIVYLNSISSLSKFQQRNIDLLVKEIKLNLIIDNLSEAFDFIYLAENETEEAFTHNLVKRSFDLTKIGNPTFDSNGVKGSTGNYYKTGYIPSSDAVAMSQDSISVGVCINEAVEKNVVKIPLGTYDSTPSAKQIYVLPSYSDDFNCALNDTNGLNKSYKNAYKGFYGGSRTEASIANVYINYKKYDSNVASVGLSDNEVYILARNLDGAQNANYDKYCSAFFLGKGFSEEEYYSVINAFNNYKNRLNSKILIDNIGIVGDSISDNETTLFAWPSKIDYDLNTITNYAISGHSINIHMSADTDLLTGDVYKSIILALGTNDNNAGDMGALRTIVEASINKLKLENPTANIYYMNVLPRWDDILGSNEIDKSNIRAMISLACSNTGITCWDTYTVPWITFTDTQDGTHPTSAGALKIWDKIKVLI